MSAGTSKVEKASDKRDETLSINETTHPWSPKARLEDLYHQRPTLNNKNIVNLLQGGSFTTGGTVRVTVDLISVHAQTEFSIAPSIQPTIRAEPCTEDIFQLKKVGNIVTAAALTRNENGGSLSRDCSGGSSAGGNGSCMQNHDFEGNPWTLESDLHSSFLRFSLVFDNISKIPRNHLR